MLLNTKIKLYFDGGYSYKRKVGTWGYVIKDEEDNVLKFDRSIVKSDDRNVTNNVAEYEGLLKGLKYYVYYIDEEDKAPLEIYGDSKMVCKMAGKEWGWSGNDYNPHPDYPHLREVLHKVHDKLDVIDDYTIKWVPRNKNKFADLLTSVALIDKGFKNIKVNCPKCSSGNFNLKKFKNRKPAIICDDCHFSTFIKN